MILTKQFVSYVIIGLIANGLFFLFFAVLTWMGLSPEFTISILYPVYIALTFIFNKSWSFNHKGHISMTAIKYLIAYFCCYVLNVAELKLFVGYIGYSHLIVQAVVIPVNALLLFLTQKHLIFKTQDTYYVKQSEMNDVDYHAVQTEQDGESRITNRITD